jgi:hypothetical protein
MLKLLLKNAMSKKQIMNRIEIAEFLFDTKCVQSSNSKELALKHFRFLTAIYSTLKEVQMSEIEANVIGRSPQLLLTVSRPFLTI